MRIVRMLENWAAIAVALLLILVAPMNIVKADDWPGGHVEPNTTVTNTTANTTIPQTISSEHYMLAGGVLLFFIVMVAMIWAIRRG